MQLLRRGLFLLLLICGPASAGVVIAVAEKSPVMEQLAQRLSEQIEMPVQVALAGALPPLTSSDTIILIGEASVSRWQGEARAIAVLTDRVVIEQHRDKLAAAVFRDPPLQRQYDLTRYLFRDAHISLIYSNAVLPWAWPELNALEEQGVRLVRYDPEQSLNYALRDAFSNSDVLLGIMDPSVYNPQSIKNILISAYRQNIPLVGPGPAFIRAGAIASSYSSLGDTVDVLADMLLGRRPFAFIYNPYFNVDFNEQVARSLNLSLPDDSTPVVSAIRR